MAKRVYTTKGDVFSAKIDENSKKYFQLIAYDLTQLNSDVIRAFKKEYPIDSEPDLSSIVNGEVEFYAHCVVKWGVKMGLWEKVGHIKDVGSINHILFRDTNDYGEYPGQKIVSEKWYVWHIGDEKFTRVDKLVGDNRKAEIGLIINPESIVYRMRTGEYDFKFYPDFE
jgi:hypothetical protein